MAKFYAIKELNSGQYLVVNDDEGPTKDSFVLSDESISFFTGR